MDWEPSPGAALDNGGWTRRPPATWDTDDLEPDLPVSSDWDSFAINKQRMFAPPQAEETGLENLLAGWGLGGGVSDSASSMAASTDGQRPGFLVDQSTLRAIGWSLVLARIIGATITAFDPNGRHLLEACSSANRPVLGLELGVAVLKMAFVWTTCGPHISPSIAMGGSFDLVSAGLRCVALFKPGIIDNALGLKQHDVWRVTAKWSTWAVINLIVSCT